MGVTTSSSTYGTMDPGELYPQDYEDCTGPMVEYLRKVHVPDRVYGRLSDRRSRLKLAEHWRLLHPELRRNELEFLGLDRFEPTPRSQDPADEDVFCAKMRRLGPRWYRDLEVKAVESSVLVIYRLGFYAWQRVRILCKPALSTDNFS
ncbi:hypothetical protein DHEL01_v210890 [Diaporthe helianthi]|uniref:Uncharacterized protein n=1 Tax=Diaporthe helianthi TaxID=158607 RepID=A0A2P5HKD7_DIAHE|nr:hypothetical protein DHEL01_v210890 [Diaporthe helianthi]